jgi:hypothetical protein
VRWRGSGARARPATPLLIRAAAAEMPRFGLREAAAMRLVIEQRAPETFERSALRRLARPCQDTRAVALKDAAVAAAALEQLSQPVARESLATRCARRSEREAAARCATIARGASCEHPDGCDRLAVGRRDGVRVCAKHALFMSRRKAGVRPRRRAVPGTRILCTRGAASCVSRSFLRDPPPLSRRPLVPPRQDSVAQPSSAPG